MSEQNPTILHKQTKDLTGQRFGEIVVAKFSGYFGTTRKDAWWWCRCNCGQEKMVIAKSLIQGFTHSCGCLRRELARKQMTTHGKTNSPEFAAWNAMIQRCCNPNAKSFKNYGGRGISVCERWRNSFSCFLQDMGARTSPEHSIERVDNNGDYSPDNVVWALPMQQAHNRRTNHLITFHGVTLCATEWASKLGITLETLLGRLKKWPLEKALTTPRQVQYVTHLNTKEKPQQL